jgi:pantoate--beta-alanine ligase
MPTVREDSGLAMSSRNTYLSPKDRTKAAVIYGALKRAKALFEKGEKRADMLLQAAKEEISKIPEIKIDYIEILDPENLKMLKKADRGCLMAVSVNFKGVHLIDNIIMERSA